MKYGTEASLLCTRIDCSKPAIKLKGENMRSA